jgi:hypothetical protein
MTKRMMAKLEKIPLPKGFMGVRRASAAAQKFWGVSPLYIEENDCD